MVIVLDFLAISTLAYIIIRLHAYTNNLNKKHYGKKKHNRVGK